MAVNDELVIRPLEDGRFAFTAVKRDHRPDYSSREELRGVGIVLAASAMGMLRGIVGFLTFLIAFALRTSDAPLWQFGFVVLASSLGSLLGSLAAPALRRNGMEEERILQIGVGATAGAALFAAWGGGIVAAAVLALCIGLGTIPAAIAGLLFAGWIAENLRDPLVVVVTLTGYGILLALADLFGKRRREMADLGIGDALMIGTAQALALVPGTSRSGVTITMAMALGFTRKEAARFSFLLSVPVILLATIYEAAQVFIEGATAALGTLALGALISCVVAYLTIGFFMRVVNAIGLVPFAVYRLLLAAVILLVVV